jgi:hypothetical protein
LFLAAQVDSSYRFFLVLLLDHDGNVESICALSKGKRFNAFLVEPFEDLVLSDIHKPIAREGLEVDIPRLEKIMEKFR